MNPENDKNMEEREEVYGDLATASIATGATGEINTINKKWFKREKNSCWFLSHS